MVLAPSVVQPIIGDFAQRIYDQLEPIAWDDVNQEWALATYVGALDPMFQEIDDYASDGDDGEPGWSILLDLNRCPTKALPFMGQFVGVQLTPGLTDAQMRARIAAHPGFGRGTPSAIIAAAQAHLTGTGDVLMTERYTGDPYKLYVATRTSQTPNSTQTLADIMAAKPAGIILTYETIAGQTFQELLTNASPFSSTYTTYATFQGVLKNAPGT